MSVTITTITLYTLLLLLTPSHGYNETSFTTDRTCATSFTVLEDDLLSQEENRYNLLKAFYPPRNALPVFVTVTYLFGETGNQSVWYWSESEFYLIQPLDVLQFTSLFHSNFYYRMGKMELHLNQDCAEAGPEFMEMLTQRLKLYAQTDRVSVDTNPLRISDIYTAVAASQDEINSDKFQSMFVCVWLHIIFIIFPISTVIIIYTCDPIQLLLGDKTRQKLCDESNHPRLAALIQISVVFTIFVFVLDCFAFIYTVRGDLFSDPSHSGFYLTTVTGNVIDLVALLWVIFILVSSCHLDCRNIFRKQICEPVTPRQIRSLLASATVSPLLCVANHLPYIIFSFISDPYHAGSVVMAYFMSFLLFYFIFGQFYSRLVLRTSSQPKDFPHSVNSDLVHYPDGDACRRKVQVPFNTHVVMISLIVVSPLIFFYEGILIVLFWALPITKTLEDSPTRLYTIYQGTGILIVALLTYSIVLRPSPFSVVGMLDKLGMQLQIPEKLGRKWVRMGDEEKAAVVIRTLYTLRDTGRPTSNSDGGGAYHHGHTSIPMEDLSDDTGTNNERETEEVALQENTL